MLIANPIYDSVFKSLMEDSTIAKQLLVYANSSEELQRQIDAEDEVETILLKHERVIEVQNQQLEAQNQQLKKQQEQMESLRKKLREAGFEVDCSELAQFEMITNLSRSSAFNSRQFPKSAEPLQPFSNPSQQQFSANRALPPTFFQP